VQDLLTVLVLVLLPSLAPLLRNASVTDATAVDPVALLINVTVTISKLSIFFLVMWSVGRRAIPAILHYVAHTGSRELFRLAVLAAALGVAFAAAELFGVSIALGAFFAGMSLSGSPLSRRAAEESLPLRDAFAVLFFVSVGMLFNPGIMVTAPVHLFSTLAVVVAGTTSIVFVLMRVFKTGSESAGFVAASLAQIGEFSFILVNLGMSLGLLPREARDLILGTSILAILLNPLLLYAAEAMTRQRKAQAETETPSTFILPTTLHGHVVLIGCGRVGRLILQGLKEFASPVLVIEQEQDSVQKLRKAGSDVLMGNGADERVLAAANLPAAKLLLVAIPEAFEAGQIVQQARRANPGLEIVARAHFDAEVDHLIALGANAVIMGEREIAAAMLQHALDRSQGGETQIHPAQQQRGQNAED
jgi:CPA2 family monovalent cation:H+ antiporter-2